MKKKKKKMKKKKKKNDQKYFQTFIYQNINWKMLNHILLTCIMYYAKCLKWGRPIFLVY